MRSMRSMRSMRGGLFPVVEGPCKRYAVARHVRAEEGADWVAVSKVFLRHIAPTWYRDYTLSVAELYSAGVTQWLPALAV